MIIDSTTVETDKFKGKELYGQLEAQRNGYLTRARAASELTIPSLFPPEGSDGSSDYPTPYQSVGAKGVNNLGNKMVLSLFPPNSAFFKMGLSPEDLTAIGRSEGDVKEDMYKIEADIVSDMEESGLRPALVNLMKQELVGGNSLIYIPPTVGSPEVYKLDEFVVRRDKRGNLLQLVIKEEVAYSVLGEEKQKMLKDVSDEVIAGKKMLELYTVVIRSNEGTYAVWQEINETVLPTTAGAYSEEDLPYIFVPFVEAGEQYARSYVEDYIGDIKSMEGLRQAILEGAAESARIIYLLRPNSQIKLKKLQNASSGDVLHGDPDDVGTLQSNKALDMQIIQAEAQTLRQELSSVFLLDSAVRRNAERVTAEEIRRVSQELEVALGGIYSTLSIKLQKRIVRIYLNRLIASGKYDEVFKKSLTLTITTGAAALGRGSDYQTLLTFLEALKANVPAEVLMEMVDLTELIKRLAYSLDINTAALIRSLEDMKKEQSTKQENIIAEKAAGPVAQELVKQNQE